MAFEFGVQPTQQEYTTSKERLDELYKLDVAAMESAYEAETGYYKAKEDFYWSELTEKMFNISIEGMTEGRPMPTRFWDEWQNRLLPYLKEQDPTKENYWTQGEAPWILAGYLGNLLTGGPPTKSSQEGVFITGSTVGDLSSSFATPIGFKEIMETHGLFKEPYPYPTKPTIPEKEPFAAYEEARRQGTARTLPVERLTKTPQLAEAMSKELSELRAAPDEARYTKLMQLEDIEERGLEELVKFAEGESAEQTAGISKYLLSERERGVPV